MPFQNNLRFWFLVGLPSASPGNLLKMQILSSNQTNGIIDAEGEPCSLNKPPQGFLMMHVHV